MRAWKLISLLILAGLIPVGLAQDQWIARWREWLNSVPLSGPSSPPLQTYPYNSAGSSSNSTGETNSYGNSSESSSQNGGSKSSTYGGANSSSGNGNGSANSGASRGANSNGNSGSSGSSNSSGSSQSWTSTPSNQSTHGGSSNSSNSGGAGSSSNNASNKTGNSFSSGNQESKSNAGNSHGAGKSDDPEAAAEFQGVNDLREVFRFDIHPKWILSRWPRVTTILSESALEGLRVPLVTGTNPDDLSGALTYYFDTQKVVQRITFQGYTGDEHRLVELVTQGFGMKPIPTLGAGLYMISWNGRPRSAMRLSLAAVVRSSDPLHRLEVMLEINRPRAYYVMSHEFQEVLDQDRAASRW